MYNSSNGNLDRFADKTVTFLLQSLGIFEKCILPGIVIITMNRFLPQQNVHGSNSSTKSRNRMCPLL